MTRHRELADRLTALLGLDLPPVALAFVDEPPEGVVTATEASPSACAFWRRAEREVFFAGAAQHHHCPIGAMVMGFDLPPAVEQELGGLVQSMCDGGYLTAGEAARIPSVEGGAAGILYGPLRDFPGEPAVVLLWPAPAQAMLVNEASEGVSWASTPTRVSSRPACAALPLALRAGQPGLSFGCIGMRTFTGIGPERMLAAVPGDGLAPFADRLGEVVEANETMRARYEQRRAEILG